MGKSIDTKILRQAAGAFATGITVITTKTKNDVIHGMTASSFVSVSFDPPIVSFSVSKKAKLYNMLTEGNHFGISILSSNQKDVSNHFAGQPNLATENLFREVENSFIIRDSLAWYSTIVSDIIPAGDHSIALCKVIKAGRDENRDPLIYFSGQYINPKLS